MRMFLCIEGELIKLWDLFRLKIVLYMLSSRRSMLGWNGGLWQDCGEGRQNGGVFCGQYGRLGRLEYEDA